MRARQLLTDGQIEEADRPSQFGRCHAQMLCSGLMSMDELKTGPRSDSSAGPRPERGGKIGVTAAVRGGCREWGVGRQSED